MLSFGTEKLTAAALDSIRARPAHFLASSVRHLCVETQTLPDSAAFETFLESCRSVIDLALVGNLVGPSLLPILSEMQIQRFAVDVSQLFRSADSDGPSPVDFLHPLFASITRLHILDNIDIFDEEPQESEWLRKLHILPALTHLAFHVPLNSPTLHTILKTCPNLRVLLVALPPSGYTYARGYSEDMGFVDSRFVVGTYMDSYDNDWMKGARGAEDIWARAERFIADKECGKVKG